MARGLVDGRGAEGVVLEDGERRAFSFANSPQDNALIELHVRLVPGGRFTTHVFEGMQVGDTIVFEGPRGQFTLREGTQPILFIAGATGFAPIRSIVLDAFARGITRPMRLYWGVRHSKDLYMLALCEEWQRQHSNFSVVPVVSEPEPGDGWEGRIGLVHDAMLDDFPDLSGHEVYLCGSVRMVEAAVPAPPARPRPAAPAGATVLAELLKPGHACARGVALPHSRARRLGVLTQRIPRQSPT